MFLSEVLLPVLLLILLNFNRSNCELLGRLFTRAIFMAILAAIFSAILGGIFSAILMVRKIHTCGQLAIFQIHVTVIMLMFLTCLLKFQRDIARANGP